MSDEFVPFDADEEEAGLDMLRELVVDSPPGIELWDDLDSYEDDEDDDGPG